MDWLAKRIERTALALVWALGSGAELMADTGTISERFDRLEDADWSAEFHDPCDGDWRERWALDGLKAEIENGPQGMSFAAGPVNRDDSCHAVLWTRQSFAGDIKIEYDYTKLDETVHNVTILYIQATGKGAAPYAKDIFEWSGLREVPAMSLYFNHMNAYHISYAAFDMDNADPAADYIRARRYMPEAGRGLADTELSPSYEKTGLFETGVTCRVTVIKSGTDLYMRIRSSGKERLCYWNADTFPPVAEGRVGLRHMFTRSARYRDFRVSVLDTSDR